jgi:hypothetical protein
MFKRVGWSKLLSKYGADLIELVAIGYTLTVNEDWTELDRSKARELTDERLRAVQLKRAELGVEPISLEDADNRVTIMAEVLMFDGTIPSPIREYLYGLPAHQRIQHFAPLLFQMGAAMANPKARHAEAFPQAQDFAWRCGVGLGLLTAMREIPGVELPSA